jgi:hypothetical protein
MCAHNYEVRPHFARQLIPIAPKYRIISYLAPKTRNSHYLEIDLGRVLLPFDVNCSRREGNLDGFLAEAAKDSPS